MSRMTGTKNIDPRTFRIGDCIHPETDRNPMVLMHTYQAYCRRSYRRVFVLAWKHLDYKQIGYCAYWGGDLQFALTTTVTRCPLSAFLDILWKLPADAIKADR